MAKSRRYETDERTHDKESLAHKKRREERQRLEDAKYRPLDDLEDSEDEFETFEPMQRKNGRGK